MRDSSKVISLVILLVSALSCSQNGEAPSLEGPKCATCRIFVSSTSYTGAGIGGIQGADAKCASDAAKPSDGVFKALLVDGSTRRACTTSNCSAGTSGQIDWVIHPNTIYTRLDGTTITTSNASGLLSFNLTTSISGSFLGVWTGLSTDWQTASHCGGWASTSGNGDTGNAINVNSGAISGSTDTCTANAYIYCVEQ